MHPEVFGILGAALLVAVGMVVAAARERRHARRAERPVREFTGGER